ncbi:MAG TPA: peptidoglycan DD-metalloendopeptidase family protein [Caulobacteraceae bacterium]
MIASNTLTGVIVGGKPPMLLLLLASLATTALAGCATPEYPIKANYTPPPPITPKYPITQTPASLTEPASATDQARNASTQSEPAPIATDAPAAAPTSSPAPVQSSSLPPVTTAPESRAPAPAETSAPPPSPAYQPAPTPPPVYEAPVRRTEVRVVTGGKLVKARGMYRDYEVQEGDHLDAIARDLEASRDELVEVNHLKRPYRLRPGQHIRVPVAKAYVVESGDTLATIGRRFGVGVGELANLNDLPTRGRLSAGMFIALPAHYTDHGPTRETFSREVYANARPRASYATRAPERTPAPAYQSGPYVPSSEALAAGAAKRAEGSRGESTPTYSYAPSYETRPTPEAPINSAAVASLGQGRFIWPVRGSILAPFGTSGIGRRNDGVDIGAPQGSAVRASAVGQVVYAGDQVPGFGNLVLIKHTGGWVSAYAHLGSVSVHMRDDVYQGEQVGTVGESGGVSQPQLHFELRYAASPADKAKPVDPLLMLPK